MSFFITNAYADTATSAAGNANGNLLSMVLPFAILFGAIYFLVIRPQTTRQRELKNLIDNLAVGDEVVTTGGLMGKITKINDNYIMLNISNNVEIKLLKNAVSNVMPKGTLKS